MLPIVPAVLLVDRCAESPWLGWLSTSSGPKSVARLSAARPGHVFVCGRRLATFPLALLCRLVRRDQRRAFDSGGSGDQLEIDPCGTPNQVMNQQFGGRRRLP